MEPVPGHLCKFPLRVFISATEQSFGGFLCSSSSYSSPPPHLYVSCFIVIKIVNIAEAILVGLFRSHTHFSYLTLIATHSEVGLIICLL